MKFIENALYIMGNYSVDDLTEEGFYKAAILVNRTFGSAEIVLAWANVGECTDYKFYDFTPSENEDLVIDTDHPDPVLQAPADGAVSPLYATERPGTTNHLSTCCGLVKAAAASKPDGFIVSAQQKMVFHIMGDKKSQSH